MSESTERSQELGSNPKTQFTQGPWRVISGEFIADDDGNTVANVIAYAIEFPAPACISFSDARLIAAAPQMYEALRAMYYALVSEPIVDGEDVEDCWLLKPSAAQSVMQNALRAIAKAEGRSL